MHVNLDLVTGFQQADSTTGGSLRRNVTDRNTRSTARETPVGNECAAFAQAQTLQVRGGVQHLLHAGAALRALILNHHNIAGFHVLRQNLKHGFILRLNHKCLTHEVEKFFINAGGFDDRTVLGDIAAQNRQTAVFRVSMLHSANAPVFGVRLMRFVLVRGRERLRGAHPAGCGKKQFVSLLARGTGTDIPFGKPFVQRIRMNRMNVLVQQPGTVQLTQQRGDTARTVHMLNVILRRVRRNLRQTGHMARNTVDIVQREVSAGLMRNSQGVQHGIGRTAHSHIQRHSVLEGFLGGDRTGQNGLVILLVVALRQANNALTRL